MSKFKQEDKSPKISRRQFIQVSAASTALMAGQFAIPGASWSADGKILRIRNYSDILTLDPAHCKSKNEDIINDCIQNKLICYKPGDKWEWQPMAAEYMKQLTPTKIEFKLKPGIMFTNGFGEMTSEDVKYSFERIADPATKSAYASDWKLLDTVEIKDKYTGVIVLKEPFAPIWMTSLPGISGVILSKKAMESVGGSFSNTPPACSGPYIFKEWKPKQVTVIVRNPDWKGTKPDFDEVHFYPIDDEKTAEIGFEAGDLDFTRISVSSYEMFQSKPSPEATVVNKPSLYYSWMGINMDNPVLKDVKIRKAIQKATDIESILEAAYFGQAKPATGIIPPGLLGHRAKSINPPKADPKGAKKLLAEAGFPDGIDITLDCLNKSTIVTQAQVIQASLGEAGIRVKVNVHESGEFWVLGSEKEMKEKVKNIQLITNRFSSQPDPYWYTMWFVSEQVGVWNWERFSSKEFDRLHKEAAVETDPAKRDKMYQKMQDLMEESGCYRFITHESAPIIYRNSIVPAMTPEGIPMVRFFKRA
ncbi:ABC transporter substrate-binding protein [Desulfospira joergensenii]|uniref:ABC transporter substrate-binding protein n=1 Tax=Desulfospira joergensenii TaxID=53329 RepID=UPI0003B65CD7|nr:ABC transporter substrate-binding protein [Desulfospira joergensenii]